MRSAVNGGAGHGSTSPPEQQLLAAHHARYTRLLRSFLAWKRHNRELRRRRQRVAAACRVGAVFREKSCWERWRMFATERRQLRQETERHNAEDKEDDTSKNDSCSSYPEEEISQSSATSESQAENADQLDAFHRRYKERILRQMWNSWGTWTRRKVRQDQQRRRAVRFYYFSLLGKGFRGFHSWYLQRQDVLGRVDTMQSAVDTRIMRVAFLHWEYFTGWKKAQALKYKRAVSHSDSQLVKRVWQKGILFFFENAVTMKTKQMTARKHHIRQTMRQIFTAWRDVWKRECVRDQALSLKLRVYEQAKKRDIRAAIFEKWSEYTRAKAAKRVVNAQVRGEAQQRILRKYFSLWISYISFHRWEQITQARADQHYQKVVRRKCLQRWRLNVLLRQRYRKKTRTALVHWKLALQRKTFDGWKKYLFNKRMKQQRIHEALEFRHQQIIREGVRHWMTAALHLQEQREHQVTCKQASHTAHIWRRVAVIARHWRYLAIRSRRARDKEGWGDKAREIPRRTASIGWVAQNLEGKTSKTGSAATVPRRYANAQWADDRSPLSEFILLPRNRPQPRRPVDVLLFGQADTGTHVESKSRTSEALRCGFQFPAEPFTPLSAPRFSTVQQPHQNPEIETGPTRKKHSEPSYGPLSPEKKTRTSPPSSTLNHLDTLEQQLVTLCNRKRDWRVFQQQLQELRQDVEVNPRMLPQLRGMEEQHQIRSKQWIQTKEQIRSLAAEIQLLRNALCNETTSVCS